MVVETKQSKRRCTAYNACYYKMRSLALARTDRCCICYVLRHSALYARKRAPGLEYLRPHSQRSCTNQQ